MDQITLLFLGFTAFSRIVFHIVQLWTAATDTEEDEESEAIHGGADAATASCDHWELDGTSTSENLLSDSKLLQNWQL